MPTLSFATLLYLASFTLAQNLSFVRPQFNAFDTNDNGTPQLIAGENVTIEWQSDFQFTSLRVYQEVGRNLFQSDVLAQGFRRDRTTVRWEVGSLPGSDSLDGSFHFELRNGVDPDCDGCSLNSENFVVSRREAASATTGTASAASSLHPTQTHPSTASQTSTASSTAGVAGAQNTAAPAAAESGGSNNHLGIGLGVGLGLGIPLVLAILAALFCVRRRRKRRNSLPRGRQPSPANSPDRASGAWLYQDGRQSQQSMLFRQSTTARSEVSAWSHRSWIEPFEFEQVEMRDQDAISQLRQSIYSSAPTRRSQVSLSNAGSEWGMLEGIPEQPQAVHDGRWSHTL